MPGLVYSQTTLIYYEDFESTDTSNIHLNTNDVGSHNGINQWVINNKYLGQPIFPNTISQDSTFGGKITHPDSNYLHIRDINISAVQNANFDPNTSSDRFTRLGSFCTLGHSDVRFAFFYLCMGNANSYGQVYYKADGGPWTLASGTNYSGVYKWKYEEIIDPAYDNINNLQFGFRWINGISTDTASSWAIDDIKLAGTYDPVKYPVHLKIPVLFNVPVCQNGDMLLQVTLSAPLCGEGIYQVELSGPKGDFSKSKITGSYYLYNDNLSQFLNVHIASNTTPDSCYRIRITRTDVKPPIVSDTSICFQVLVCPNTIMTKQPVVLKDPKDTICVGSVIDVPFNSTGVFVNNKYIAQLSDSNGNFTSPVNVLGFLPSSQTFPDPLKPGTVSGLIAPTNQPIPPGCKYYIRVISTSPAVTGSVYGPFCIRNCDVETNDKQDIHVCVTPTVGIDTIIPLKINSYDSTVVYSAGNTFKVQVLSSKNFAVLNTGSLGFVVSDTGTYLHLQIPGLIGLKALGMGTGIFYVRITASNSNQPWNMLGTLIRLVIGSPYSTPLSVLNYDFNTGLTKSILDTSICFGGTLFYLVQPYDQESDYAWTLNNNNQWAEGYSTGIIFNQSGDFKLSVVETNYGCVGPGSDTAKVHVRGTPSVSILGPPQVCAGDTIHYSVSLENETYYKWSSPNGTILDTANNNLSIVFNQAGSQQILIHAVGVCGVADGSKAITVKAYPLVSAGNDTTVCRSEAVTLSTTSGAYTYLWSNGANTRTITVTPDTTTTYIIASKVLGTAGCTSRDTVTVFVENPVIAQIMDSICPRQPLILDPEVPGAKYYLWSTGASTQSITVKDSGTYVLRFKSDTAVCKTENTYNIKLMFPGQGNGIDTVICSGSEVILDAGMSGATYYWSTDDSGQAITVRDTGIYTVTITDVNGKCVEARLYRVNSDDCQLSFPNVITPNGDGKNDFWFNTEATYFEQFNVKIFDRWGILIYESDKSDFKWDGRNMKGTKVSDSVYYYIVNAGSGLSKHSLRGFVTVLE